jgi:hypothetical protein
MRPLAAGALAAVALGVAGCGGSGRASGLPKGAAKVAKDAVAFVAVKTDAGSAQWRQTLQLAARFPASAPLLAQLRKYRSALGSETDVALLDFAHGGDDYAVLTRPSSLGRLETLAAPHGVVKLSGGWVAVGPAAGRLGSGGLDRDKDFQDGFGKLDVHAVVRAWVRGSAVQAALDRSLASGGAAPKITHELGDLKSIAASARAEGGGARFEIDGTIDPKPSPATFTPTLQASMPGGAVLFVSTTRLDEATRLVLRMVAKSDPKFETQLQQVQTVLGLDLQRDVYPLLEGESAVAIYPAGRVPSILFEQKVADTAKADAVARRIGAIAQLSGEAKVETVQIGGATGQKLSFKSSNVVVYDGVARGRIFVTNSLPLAQESVSAPPRTLADDPSFRSARAAARLPSKVAAFAYADLGRGLPYVFSASGGASATARTNVKPLGPAAAYLVPGDGGLRLSGFVSIK